MKLAIESAHLLWEEFALEVDWIDYVWKENLTVVKEVLYLTHDLVQDKICYGQWVFLHVPKQPASHYREYNLIGMNAMMWKQTKWWDLFIMYWWVWFPHSEQMIFSLLQHL